MKMTATDYKKNKFREHRKKENGYDSYLKEMVRTIGHKWMSGFAAWTKDGDWADDLDEAEFVERYWRPKRSKNIKKFCNRKLRHIDPETAFQNGDYKKLTEFWWDLY